MKKSSLHILPLVLFVSCNPTKNEVSLDNKSNTFIKQIDTVEKVITEVTNDEFSKDLRQQEIFSLPYAIGSGIELPHFENVDERELIWSMSQKPEIELNSLDKFFKFKNLKGLEQVLYEDIDLIEPNFNSLFQKRFKPINDSIEVLLMSSNLKESRVNIWFVLTYDIRNNKAIDNAIVAVFDAYSDTYYESYFSIEKDYFFKSIISSSYESNPLYEESNYRIEPNGKITRLLKQEYSYEEGDNLQSFRGFSDNYEVLFYEDSYDQGTPTFDLRYYKRNKSEYDSLLTIEEPVFLRDNKNRKWLTVYKYKDLDLDYWRNSAHYRRYFYTKESQIDFIQEVEYSYLNDSVISLSFKKASSDKLLDQKEFIKINYDHNETWLNSYFNIESYDKLKTKFTYSK